MPQVELYSALTVEQRNTLAGLVDAAVPRCPHRRKFYEIAVSDLNGAIEWLRQLDGANQVTVEMVVTFVKRCLE